jgi:hypothetical protein
MVRCIVIIACRDGTVGTNAGGVGARTPSIQWVSAASSSYTDLIMDYKE